MLILSKLYFVGSELSSTTSFIYNYNIVFIGDRQLTKTVEEQYWSVTFTPKESLTMTNQRDQTEKTFLSGQIKLQLEGRDGNFVVVRGKYPNDAYFVRCELSDLEIVVEA